MKSVVIVTNNPLVVSKLSDRFDVSFQEQGYLELLERVRDLVHKGAVLLTHPQAGSIKPGETPYRSVMVRMPETEAPVDAESLSLIESAITTTRKFPVRTREFRPGSLEDFQLVDYSLMSSAVESATQCHS